MQKKDFILSGRKSGDSAITLEEITTRDSVVLCTFDFIGEIPVL